jgi:hypothetical protein
MNSYSQIKQDLWVESQIINYNSPGFFVDFGAAHPTRLNNTYLFEAKYNWKGISYDIGPPHAHGCGSMTMNEYINFWNSNRNTPIIIADLLATDIKESFIKNNVPTVIDYLTLDLEPPISTYKLLYSLPYDLYSFKYITFEHDSYRGFEKERIEARNFLNSKGYVIAKSVEQDDFYIKKDLI